MIQELKETKLQINYKPKACLVYIDISLVIII